jgi:hypothetical protein
MLANGKVKVGDVVLYKRKKKIKQWDVNAISPSGEYIEIENDNWSERWVYRGDLLEILGDEIEITVSSVTERPPVIESKFKV